MKMNLLHRIWWRMLMELRPLLSFLAERFPKLAPWAIRLRSLAHGVVGHPSPVVVFGWAFVAWRSGVPGRPLLVVVFVVLVLVESVHRFLFESGRGGWFVGWREAWRVHRVMPSLWARTAAKTTTVQAEVGTSKEPMASARLRPVADHSKMGWWPTIAWPQVSWWVGPPPGRSFDKFAEVLDVLAANYSRCVSMDLEYDRSTDSYARLTVSFGSVLGKTIDPIETEVDTVPWQPATTTTADVPFETVQPWTPTIVDGEAA